MGSRIIERSLQANHEMSSRVNSRKSTDGKRIKYAEDVELSFLRKVCAVGKYGKRNVHRLKVEERAGPS